MSFQFDINEWDLKYDLKQFLNWIVEGITKKKKGRLFMEPKDLKREGLPLDRKLGFSKQKVERICKNFRLHSLRNRLAIILIIKKNDQSKADLKRFLNGSRQVLHTFVDLL